jgi:hypothetical protein
LQDGIGFNLQIKEDGNFYLFDFGSQKHTCNWKKFKHPNFALLQNQLNNDIKSPCTYVGIQNL